MKLLVTGGLGFIGSNFIRYILGKYDYEIVNLDKMTYCGNPENLKDIEGNPDLKARYQFIKGGIEDKNALSGIPKVDWVVNFAAETHVDRSIMAADAFVKTDILGTYNLLEFAKEQNVLLIQISTDEVYGSTAEGSFKENSPLLPSSPYASSKAGADLLAMSYFRTHQTPVIITRSANNFGPYQYPEKFIPLFVTNLLEGKKIPLYGTGENVRDWIYVIDNCEAIDAVMHKGKIGEIYNIGSGNEKTNLEVTKLILQELSLGEDMIEFVKDRKGHDFRYSMQYDKIKNLGWQPKSTFEKALQETVQWFKDNSWWWKKLKSGAFLEYYKKYYSQLGLK